MQNMEKLMSNFIVRKVAVLGAGVMGAQIAAHLANAGVPAILFDLPAREGAKNGIAQKAIEGLKKINPAPLGHPELAARITPANYEEHLDLIAGCDLVIEAIAERMDWKHDLSARSHPTSAPTRFSPPTPRACRSPGCPRASTPACRSASAACTSSIRRATCTWSS